MRYTPLLVAAAIVSTAWCHLVNLRVKTDKGYVQGRMWETIWNRLPYARFTIPYAAPPIGDLRFQDPQEIDPWEGTLNAMEEKSPCAQYIFAYPFGKEDCLYLNVYTPAVTPNNHTDLKPVMIWIYGGGFEQGSSSAFTYNPVHLLEQDVVVVTFNYRVNVFGFLALGIPGATGNQGLKDQVMVMKWVQRNIPAFGGDPNQVTIFGESAGAASVGFHMISPLSEGLFHKAILQSGSPLNPWAYQTPTKAVDNAFDLGSRLGIDAYTRKELLDALKKANFVDITRAANTMINLLQPFQVTVPFVPTIETYATNNTFLDECPISKFQNGVFTRMPVLLGFNDNEALLFYLVLDQIREVIYNAIYDITTKSLRLSSGALAGVLSDISQGSILKLSKVTSAYMFSGPVDITQRYFAMHNVGNPTYYYHLYYDNEYNLHKIFDPNINGTTHADDLSLLFHMALNSPVDPNAPFNVFRKKFITMWTNFAKYGDPTPDKSLIGLRWKSSGKQGLQLHIGNDKYKISGRAISLTDELIERMYTMALPASSSCKEMLWLPPSIF